MNQKDNQNNEQEGADLSGYFEKGTPPVESASSAAPPARTAPPTFRIAGLIKSKRDMYLFLLFIGVVIATMLVWSWGFKKSSPSRSPSPEEINRALKPQF